MTYFTWPTAPELWPQSMEVRMMPNTRASTSAFDGTLRTSGVPTSKWGISITFKDNQTYAERAKVEGFLAGFEGRANRVYLYDFANPVPKGTINLTGCTVSTAAAIFAKQLVIAGAGAGKTLLMGDWFQVTSAGSNQLVKVTTDATANGSGVITVNFVPPLRFPVVVGATITTNKPVAPFYLDSDDINSPRGPQNMCPSFGVNFIEDISV